VEVWWQGKFQATARLLDPVVNGRLPSAKPDVTPTPASTGINFVELVHQKKDEDQDDEDSVPW
jgi:hypothetical protein